ncbi:hypothetical protein CRUP_001780 [Coryphaenoides rupestris]|nr:hypothetical protein CRUP_001780 [Coryphaenoides rupestris]
MMLRGTWSSSPWQEDTCAELTRAIEEGDVWAASTLAAALAQQNASLHIQPSVRTSHDEELSLAVVVEDCSSSCCVTVKVFPHATIFLEYGFHPRIQRWVIGQCLCSDHRSLASYGVRHHGDTAFLYLLLSRRARLSPQLVHRDQESALLTAVPPPASPSLPPSELLASQEEEPRTEGRSLRSETSSTWKCLNLAKHLAPAGQQGQARSRTSRAKFSLRSSSRAWEVRRWGDEWVVRECLRSVIMLCEHPEVACPYRDETYACSCTLQEREVKALVSAEEYERWLQRGLSVAESRCEGSYHCATADCAGWCVYEDTVNAFHCPVCRKHNCLLCKAIHEGMNCKQYQDDLTTRAINDSAARRTRDLLKTLVQSGEAMHCPQCGIIVQKKEGCDWLRCTVCHTEICWVTRGSRWGPGGPGDTSGGCRCNVNKQKCHPKCQNCH